jgi:hypothetical protein
MMLKALEPTQEPGWVLSHDGYNVLTESAVKSRFAFGNGFLGMRAARSVSRGPTWVGWLGYSRWASCRAATSPACLTCPTSSRKCRRFANDEGRQIAPGRLCDAEVFGARPIAGAGSRKRSVSN